MKQSARQLVISLSLLMAAAGAAAASDIPQIVKKDGRFALMVDGAPFVILGGQAQNSSNYPLALNKVFAAIKDMHANTLEIPVAWEQIEPVEGKFDFSYVDTLVAEARKNKVKLVLLWFGTEEHRRQLRAGMGEVQQRALPAHCVQGRQDHLLPVAAGRGHAEGRQEGFRRADDPH
jgi:hypothetical protein